MAWFKRKEKDYCYRRQNGCSKRLWYKSPTGKIIDADELERNLFVSPEDGFHVRIGSAEYFQLFDNNEFVELDKT
jgi:acetyl-CoA carboxylase carboxyl transferase subunit beta